jgi:hypothetical protein
MFPHRKLRSKTRDAMKKASTKLEEEGEAAGKEIVSRAEKAVSRTTNHRYVQFVSSGNCAIFAVTNAIEGEIMIPDQGAWRGFKDYPRLLGKKFSLLKTEMGIIDIEQLDSELQKRRPAALFMTSFAGYIAEQEVDEIAKICRENGVLLVEDASGAVGDPILARGASDIIVCSTGSPKILNLMSGGFISTDRREILENSKKIIKACKINPIVCAGVIPELEEAPRRIQTLVEYSRILKESLPSAVHKDRRGICTGFEVEEPRKLALRARERGLITDLGKGFLTTCPKYERFLKNGIVVELKNLEVFELGEEDISKIGEILTT